MGILARPGFLARSSLEPLAEPCTGGLVLSSLQKSQRHPGGRARTFGTGSGRANHALLIVVQHLPKIKRKVHQTKGKDHVTALFEKNGWSPFPFQKKHGRHMPGDKVD